MVTVPPFRFRCFGFGLLAAASLVLSGCVTYYSGVVVSNEIVPTNQLPAQTSEKLKRESAISAAKDTLLEDSFGFIRLTIMLSKPLDQKTFGESIDKISSVILGHCDGKKSSEREYDWVRSLPIAALNPWTDLETISLMLPRYLGPYGTGDLSPENWASAAIRENALCLTFQATNYIYVTHRLRPIRMLPEYGFIAGFPPPTIPVDDLKATP